MQIEGEVIHITELETRGESFKIKSIVVKTNEQYPQEIKIDFVQANVEKIANLHIGAKVKVDINIQGRKHNDTWYNSIQGWKIETQSKPNF